MKSLSAITALTLALSAGAVFAQSDVRVHPGQVCAENKCVRFSDDLKSVSIQGRRTASVASYQLSSDPVISADEFRQIFKLALIQSGVNGNR